MHSGRLFWITHLSLFAKIIKTLAFTCVRSHTQRRFLYRTSVVGDILERNIVIYILFYVQ